MAAPKVIPAAVMTVVRRQWTAPFLDWLDAFLYTLIGSDWSPVRVLTAAALPANTYSAVTLIKTANANGALTVDGVLMATGDRFWDKDAVTGSERGLFEVTQPGTAGTPWKAKRASDADTSVEFFDGKAFTVSEGTSAGQRWAFTNNAPFVLDTDTPAIAREAGVMHTDDAQTVTARKSFATTMLAVLNAGATFAHRFVSLATATRTITLPDVDLTPAQAGVATASTTPSAGGGTAPAFTGTTPLGAVDPTPAFSGTGLTAAGQVLTSTDNQTMTLNQCAGMLLVSIGGNFCVILSNTAVAGAPAVFTVAGKAATDAGVYSVFNGRAPVGAVASHTHTGAAHTHAQV